MFSSEYYRAEEDLDNILGQLYAFPENLAHVLCSLMDITELRRTWKHSMTVLSF